MIALRCWGLALLENPSFKTFAYEDTPSFGIISVFSANPRLSDDRALKKIRFVEAGSHFGLALGFNSAKNLLPLFVQQGFLDTRHDPAME